MQYAAMQHNFFDMHLVRTLQPWQMGAVRSHFLRLGQADRKLRFGMAVSDAAIEDFLARLKPGTDYFLGYLNAEDEVVGVVHMSLCREGSIEFAFSVDRAYRARGIGQALFEQAVLWARNRSIRRAFVYCLAENTAMRRLASRAGMSVRIESGECDCMLPLPPATPMTILTEIVCEQRALFVGSLDSNRLFMDRLYSVAALA